MSTKLKIRLLLTISALLLGMPAMAVTLKIATVTPEGTRWMKDMRSSAKEIKEKTDGRVQIKYYGGGIKGDDAKVLGQIRIGQLQGAALTPSALASTSSIREVSSWPTPPPACGTRSPAPARRRPDSALSATLRCRCLSFANAHPYHRGDGQIFPPQEERRRSIRRGSG